ncbi:hypothetical protein [Ramlibacter albus]|uniref:Uncharacterized protein n=1 Tax=Ramlibacter albus TaxID=2079448 RepID=A0A923S571_9BURK|nr:hypothetical protein [Ramlibacter albus]MBC5767648.1 hypothetical protein [Ramlibacter albus]
MGLWPYILIAVVLALAAFSGRSTSPRHVAGAPDGGDSDFQRIQREEAELLLRQHADDE